MDKIQKAVSNPRTAFMYLCSVYRGFFYKLKYKVINKRVKIGKNFRVRKGLKIKGPGSVIIGDNVQIDGTSHRVTPYTYSKDATIKIGNNVFLNGTRFGSRCRIEIGDYSIIGDANILDTDFHHVDPAKRHTKELPPTKPINIGRNVWIAGTSIIMKGVNIRDNSVVGAGSIVVSDIPGNCLAAGNPARVIKKI